MCVSDIVGNVFMTEGDGENKDSHGHQITCQHLKRVENTLLVASEP